MYLYFKSGVKNTLQSLHFSVLLVWIRFFGQTNRIFLIRIYAPRIKELFWIFLSLKISINGKYAVFGLGHDSSLLVFTNAFFKKVGLAIKGNIFHEIKGIFYVIFFVTAQFNEKTISYIFDVNFHHHSFTDNKFNSFFWQLIFQMTH